MLFFKLIMNVWNYIFYNLFQNRLFKSSLTMSPAVVVEKEPAAEKSKAVAAAKAEKRKVPPTEATPPAAAKKAAAASSAPPAATEVAKQVDKFFLPCFPLKNFSQDYY